MFLAASFSLFLALSITGSPVEVRNSLITLPLARRQNFSNGTIDFSQYDKARLAAFGDYNKRGRRARDIPVKSSAFDYYVEVGIGNPPKTYSLVVDTGSSITWVGAGTSYVRTDTSVDAKQPIEVNYGFSNTNSQCFFSGMTYNDIISWKLEYLRLSIGDIFYDTVTLGGGATVTGFPLGVASDWEGFGRSGEDGILGIGPKILTRGTMPNYLDGTIPTFTDCLYDQDKIRKNVVGVFFQPITTEPDSQVGALTFGGTDSTKYIGTVFYTRITTTRPASRYWGINVGITYGSTDILAFTAGIVDTGTTFLNLATDAYVKYKAATGSTYDPPTGLLRITSRQYSILQNLEFHIDDRILSLSANAQIWPRSLNYKLSGGVPRAIYLIVHDSGKPSGQGFDFIIGLTFIQRYYTVFDRSMKRVGFAFTPFSDATTN